MLAPRGPLLILLLSLMSAACSDSAGPPSSSHGVLFAVGGEGSSIFVVDPLGGKVLARPGPLPSFKSSPAFSADSSSLFFVAADQSGAAIYAIDTHSLRLQKWLDINSPAAPRSVNGLWLGGGALASVPGDPYLYIGSAYNSDPRLNPSPDAARIAVIDTTTRHVVGTIGPLKVPENGLAHLPPGPIAAHGALLAIGTRIRPAGPWMDTLFVIDPVTRVIVDSALVTTLDQSMGGTLVGVLASPDGQHVYLQHRDGIVYGYDLLTHQVIGSAHLPGFSSSIAIAPDGSRLYAVDGGMPVIFIPPSDSIEVLDATSLAVLPPISLLGQAALNNETPEVHSVTVSPDGRWLYLASGGPHLGGQPLRILVMDRASGIIVRVIPLADTGTVTLLVR